MKTIVPPPESYAYLRSSSSATPARPLSRERSLKSGDIGSSVDWNRFHGEDWANMVRG
jgi:hypothetical protein